MTAFSRAAASSGLRSSRLMFVSVRRPLSAAVAAALAAVLLCPASFAADAPAAITPDVPPSVRAAAEAINADPAMQALLADLVSPEAQKARFNRLVEIARIASPSRFEMRRQAEITKRLTEDWGFDAKDIPTRLDGHLPGAGLQLVDALPVYNVCVVIPGRYKSEPGAKSWHGQYPKVLMEGHIDSVNPGVLPPADKPYEPVKLQPATDPIVKTREELAALPEELHFDAKGRVIEDAQYEKAYKRYASLEDAQKKGGVRLYVPGYNDAMINTVAVLQAAEMMKKHGIKPVYDIWVCGTTGEEGKGNLCGMKQLYGYSQDAGKGNNALNFVANFAADSTRPGSGTVNYLGSYRFEVEYSEPAGWRFGDKGRPSAASAMSRAIAAIADIRTPWDLDKKAERTTYTVGKAECTAPAAKDARAERCTLMVDMRSPTQPPLSAIRTEIEPQFAKALEAENAAYGLKTGDKDAVSMKLVWFGDRPAYQRTRYDDVALTAWWEASRLAGVDVIPSLRLNAASLNDNVPAAVGVPTINMNVGTPAAGGGGHTWYEWGIPGDGEAEGRRIYKMILSALIASGYETSSGKVIEPSAPPIGARTTEEMFK